jgi:hypothetical protein
MLGFGLPAKGAEVRRQPGYDKPEPALAFFARTSCKPLFYVKA